MAPDSRSDRAIFRRLLQRSAKYRPHLVGIFALDLLATPLALLSPLALKLVVDNVLGDEPLPTFLAQLLPVSWHGPAALLLFSVALLVLVSVLTQVQSLAATYMRTYTGEKMALDFRSALFWHGQRLSMAYHDARGVANTLYRVQYDTMSLQNVTIDGIIPMVTAAITIVAMIWVISGINPTLALVALAICPVLVYLIKSYRDPLREGWRKQKRLDHAAMSIISEVFSALRVVKAFTQERREHERYTEKAGESLNAYLRVNLMESSFGVATGTVTALGTGAVLFIGVRSIQAGGMTIGDLLVVMSYIGLLYGPLRIMGRRLASLQKAFASAERAFDLLDETQEVPECDQPRAIDRARGDIQLEKVTFAYETGSPVLREVDMQIPAGSRVGIIGATGAGKTTLMSLLMRFYDPNEGVIRLDGVDLREYRIADLRAQYGIVLQDSVLFSTSILDNIAYGRPGASHEDIVEAAKSANVHSFIESLPRGYETEVGDRGMRLSGGERQRIALARAFLRDAPILLLDEPTSSVDVGTEAGIMEAMERLMHNRTTFMIAHRLSTLRACDLLFEVSNARIQLLKSVEGVAYSAATAHPIS